MKSHAAPSAAVPTLTRAPSGLAGRLQRKCGCAAKPAAAAPCKECQRKQPQGGGAAAGPAHAHGHGHGHAEAHGETHGGTAGQSLAAPLRQRMEAGFGVDFAQVRLHDDSHSHAAAHGLNALAFTSGQDIYFGARQYAPGQREGQRLLAHELAHTVQQRGTAARPSLRSADADAPDTPLEREADVAAATVVDGAPGRVAAGTAAMGRVQRAPPGGVHGESEQNKAMADGVLYEKWSPQVEALYRKVGDPRAEAIGRCRREGKDTCAWLLTLAEVNGLMALAQESKGDEKKVRAGLPKVLPYLAYAGPVVGRGLLGGAGAGAGTGAAVGGAAGGAGAGGAVGGAVGGGVAVGVAAAAVAVIAVVAIAFALYELWELGKFEQALRDKGFTILEDPLRQSICVSCHTPTPARPTPFGDFAPSPPGTQPWPRIGDFPDTDPDVLRHYLDPLPQPQTPPVTDPKKDPKQDPQLQPKPGTDPLPAPKGEEKKPRRCPRPTGLSARDPIAMSWFKPQADDWYPPHIELQGHTYDRDTPATLPHGEPIGVAPRYWPSLGKLLQLAPDCGVPRSSTICPNSSRFREVLEGYGFQWGGPGPGGRSRRFLQADHVQDVQWGAPDGNHLDTFENLWPMDGAANMSTGSLQNLHQVVSFCETENAAAPITAPIREITQAARAGRPYYGRYFAIRNVSRGPA